MGCSGRRRPRGSSRRTSRQAASNSMSRPPYDHRAVMIVARIRSDVSGSDGVAIAQEPLPARAGRLQHQQVVDPGFDLWLAAVADHGRDAIATAPALEGVLVGAPADLEPRPRVLDDVHARARHTRPGREEVLDEPLYRTTRWGRSDAPWRAHRRCCASCRWRAGRCCPPRCTRRRSRPRARRRP